MHTVYEILVTNTRSEQDPLWCVLVSNVSSSRVVLRDLVRVCFPQTTDWLHPGHQAKSLVTRHENPEEKNMGEGSGET